MTKTYTMPTAAKLAPLPPPMPRTCAKNLPLRNPVPPAGAFMYTLHTMLGAQRAHGSSGEMFAFSQLVADNSHRNFHIDGAGNLHVDARAGASRTLFTSHTDTCHRNSGNEPNPVYEDREPSGDVIWRAAPGLCLGADDGAGVALMAGLLEHNVPGYYIFFRGEEQGGVGSSWLAENMPTLLGQFDRAIAFDRAGYSDVITHQGGSRCASDAFASALAAALTPDDFSMAYTPDSTGVYTDTAEFVDLIPECTNLSVGYKSQHGDGEWQNVSFLQRLVAQLLTVPWETLPTERDPSLQENQWDRWSIKGIYATPLDHQTKLDQWEQRRYTYTGGGYYGQDDLALFDAIDDAISGGSTNKVKRIVSEIVHPEEPDLVLKHMTLHIRGDDLQDAYQDLLSGVDPCEVADYLYECCASV